jgi:hypothetical protein
LIIGEEGNDVAEGSAARLDVVDSAIESGWHIESTRSTDQFERNGVTVLAQYSDGDAITSIVRSKEGRDDETIGFDSAGKDERLKIWLGIRAVAENPPVRRSSKIPKHLIPKPGDWTRDEFMEAVGNPGDRTFLLRFLELVDANSQLPSQEFPFRLYFGVRPGGNMFVYPFGRGYPPFKFSVKDGRLLISGCWKQFEGLKGHKGFAEIASMLNLDEKGPASSVSVAGLDANEVWEVGGRVSKAING